MLALIPGPKDKGRRKIGMILEIGVSGQQKRYSHLRKFPRDIGKLRETLSSTLFAELFMRMATVGVNFVAVAVAVGKKVCAVEMLTVCVCFVCMPATLSASFHQSCSPFPCVCAILLNSPSIVVSQRCCSHQARLCKRGTEWTPCLSVRNGLRVLIDAHSFVP